MYKVLEYEKDKFEINPDNLLNFIKFRRSIRQFKNTEVEEDKIKNIIDAGRFTQTSTNSQDVSYIVIRRDIDKLVIVSLNEKGQYILNNLT